MHQFIQWLHENNMVIVSPGQVERADITEYLAYLVGKKISGQSRARKMAALHEYFRYLVDHGYLAKSPAAGIETPKREKNGRAHLVRDEYTKMLSLAGSNARDYAILQVFLQTGVRVSELVTLTLADVDLANRIIHVHGKGMVARSIELEKKAVQAIKNYLKTRPAVLHDQLFLNRDNAPISERGVRKLVARYLKAAGITKKASCHSLRHTFATYKAQQGVSAYRLKDWLGHTSLKRHRFMCI